VHKKEVNVNTEKLDFEKAKKDLEVTLKSIQPMKSFDNSNHDKVSNSSM